MNTVISELTLYFIIFALFKKEIMNVHEYQGKEILKSFGVAIQEGIVAENAEEAVIAAKNWLSKPAPNGGWWKLRFMPVVAERVVVKLAKNLDELRERTNQIIGMNLVTPQTGPAGKKVHKVLIAQDVYYPGPSKQPNFIWACCSIVKPVVILSCILPRVEWISKKWQKKTPERIFKEGSDPRVGLQPFPDT